MAWGVSEQSINPTIASEDLSFDALNSISPDPGQSWEESEEQVTGSDILDPWLQVCPTTDPYTTMRPDEWGGTPAKDPAGDYCPLEPPEPDSQDAPAPYVPLDPANQYRTCRGPAARY